MPPSFTIRTSAMIPPGDSKPLHPAYGAYSGDTSSPATGYPYPYSAPYYGAPPPRPPPPQPYYPAPPPAAPRPADRRRPHVCLGVAIGTIVFAVAVFWIATAPRPPSFTLTSAAVTSFSVSSSGVLSGDFNVTMSMYNPNKKASIRYDAVAAGVYYGGTSMAEAALPPMDQGALTARTVAARLVASASYVGPGAAGVIRSDRERGGGAVRFQVKVLCNAAFEVNGLNARRRKVTVYCDDVAIRFGNATAAGGELVGPPRPCRVK